ncbi:aspartate aminotransferase family protein (plasmid) [Photobacterium sp. GJ3]|uniref:aspartate aminotransferase family protein n=1 Tax=Photobacterium sp. GJ3 TaxID=2829502 RepID=UPI001B8CD14C|nr:aspartate aminotransferase family protein [Photobacterium sp. GJ3]QUJ69366.1 aspartate aminotransferase family protein [Photobacterium sp. GJ3]
MTYVINKKLNERPILLSGGDGVWLQDAAGNKILDTCGGVAVSSLGHCHPKMIQAMKEHAHMLSWAHAGSFTTHAAEALGEFLVERSGGLGKIQFLSGGSEAVEVAMKAAYQYHCENGQPSRTQFISRRQSYHGSTFGALALSGNLERQSIFTPLLSQTEFVSPCYAYRDQRADESDEQYVHRLAHELESRIQSIGAENVAAFIAEPVVGSTNGAVPAVKGYLRAMKAVCERHGVLLMLDDVMSGMGRTGYLFAHLEDDVQPDIVVIGKGLAAGYQPISAYLLSDTIHDVLAQGSGILRNGQTHVNHPFACQIALSAQQILEEEDLLANVRDRGVQMRQLFQDALSDFEYLGDIRGRGLFTGLEFVGDRQEQSPLNGGAEFVSVLKQTAFEMNLLIYPGSGTVDGVHGNHLLFAPPFIASSQDIETMVGKVAHLFNRLRPNFAAWAESFNETGSVKS